MANDHRRPVRAAPFTRAHSDVTSAPRQIRILVADDDRDSVLTLMMLLRDEGHEVRGVYNGQQALKAMLEFEPHDSELCFTISSARIERLVLLGWERDELWSRLSALAEPPPEVAALIDQAVRCDARAEWVAASGFLWVDDARELARLVARKSLAELFIQPSPAGGLLLRSGVPIERVVRACRAIGIEVMSSGKRVRARARAR